MPDKIYRNIPNFVTCCNLFSGCVATVLAFEGRFYGAFLFILLSAVFDFLDGMMARLLNVHSVIGKDLDSLSDDVSFGLAPSVIVFSLLKQGGAIGILPYAAFLIAVFSAWRLAKFNNDARQTSSFVGLPVPANALFWSSLAISKAGFLHSAYLILPLICLSSWLLVSEIPMFSLKFKNLRWEDNKLRFLFLILSALLLLVFGFSGFMLVVVCYILISVWNGRRASRSAVAESPKA